MTQREQILAHLRQHGEITPLEALQQYGCYRLGARIYDLRQEGHDIKDVGQRANGKRWARYVLIGQMELV